MEALIEELKKKLEDSHPEEVNQVLPKLREIINLQEERVQTYYWNR